MGEVKNAEVAAQPAGWLEDVTLTLKDFGDKDYCGGQIRAQNGA